MIRKTTKEQLLSILQMMLKLHHTKEMENGKTQRKLLTQCQESAIAIGTILEKKVEEAVKIVPLLEMYCEEVYVLAESAGTGEKIDLEYADGMLYDVINAIEELQEVYQIVFMPYKAAMWDALESIYLAAKDDVGCEALVVPVPYYSFDQKKKEWIPHYEGELFPPNIPVTSYQKYNLQEERPDVIYVHNPYDDSNYVTSVHPSFYSAELKKYTKKLIYVPYYVTTGAISPEHTILPVYFHMDYAIVQGERFKRGFKGLPYEDKIIPLGSPKLDRIIRMCKSGEVKMPKEWEKIVKGRRTLMLNTSISCLLDEGSIMLDKLMWLFKKIKQYPGLALIWRPHPLLRSTIESMRPQLLMQYEELIAYFQENGVGVFDTTPDITSTVALSDGYIGELSTSVVNLFGAAGKPMLILNDYITEDITPEERLRFPIQDLYEKDGVIYALSQRYNGLFRIRKDLRQIELIAKISDQQKWQMGGYSFAEHGGEVFLSPYMMNNFYYLDDKKNINAILSQNSEETLFCYKSYVYQNRIFYLPAQNGQIIVYDCCSGLVQYCADAISAYKKTVIENWGDIWEETWDCAAIDNILYITANYSKKILCLDMDTLQYEIVSGPDENDTYTGIVSDEDILYLAGGFSGNVYKWNPKTGELYYKVLLLQQIHAWRFHNGRALVHRALVKAGDFVVTIPGTCDGMVCICKETGTARCIAENFWKNAEKAANQYQPQYMYAATFGKKWRDSRVIVQRGSDWTVAIIDPEKGDYETVTPELTGQALEQLITGENGFEKPYEKWTYMYQESAFFPVDRFFRLIEGNREAIDEIAKQQIRVLSDIAENLDGTCGEKTHAFVMESLRKESRG